MAKQKPSEEEVVTDSKAESARDSVTVTWRAGSREYSRDLHGDDFMALATEFAEKKKGTLV